jgi:hypothetical protein
MRTSLVVEIYTKSLLVDVLYLGTYLGLSSEPYLTIPFF